jgi:hypothetical protein
MLVLINRRQRSLPYGEVNLLRSFRLGVRVEKVGFFGRIWAAIKRLFRG